MNQSKNELRQQLMKARLAMSPNDHKQKSNAIRSILKEAINWSNVKTVHCFEPIAELNEVDIQGFLGEIYHMYTSRRTGIKPENNWSIVSLAGNDPIPENFDVIVVPMLGFNKSLHRIGYGGGYYDKLLSTQPEAHKIGVCFEQGRVDTIQVEPHDIPLDVIITEKGTYNV